MLSASIGSASKLFGVDPSRRDSWGYVDKKGQLKLPCRFSQASPFHEGFAAVNVGADPDNCMFVDKEGKPLQLIPPFSGLARFSEGLATVYSVEQHKTVFIDAHDHSIGAFRNACDFHEGLAVVEIIVDKNGQEVEILPHKKVHTAGWKHLHGVIDKTGNYIVKPKFDCTNWHFSEGLLAVGFGSWDHRKLGYIDKDGRFTIEPRFPFASNFHDGRAMVKQPDDSSQFAIIDKQGHPIHIDKYEQVSDYNEGLAPVRLHGKWGYVDTRGKLVIGCKFDKAGLFQEGLAAVSNEQNQDRSLVRVGFIDRKGKLVIPFDFIDLKGGFSNGLAAVAIKDKTRPDYWLYGYIDHSGAWAIKPIYDDAQAFSEGLAAVCAVNRSINPDPPQGHGLPPRLSIEQYMSPIPQSTSH